MDFSLPMALFDFIPVILFCCSSVVFQRYFYDKMNRGPFALYCAGTIMILCAGIMKGLWKLLYALEICDFQALNSSFMPMQSIGFVFAAVAVLRYVFGKRSETLMAVPVITSGMMFVVFMVLGCLGASVGYTVLALRKKKKGAAVLFAVSFVLQLCMGYLSSRDFTKASMNWIGEVVNLFAQGTLLLGAMQTVR